MSYNITVITGSGSASYTVSTGARGPAGAAGQGVPTGGTTGQVLKKTSATNYATAWQDDEGGEALTFAGSDPNVGNVSGITVSGTLTSGGSTQVVFPTLIAAGDYAGKPQYTSTGHPVTDVGFGSNNFCLYTTLLGGSSYWLIQQLSPPAAWRGPINGDEAGPENVTIWTPLGSATGTPTVSAITNAPTATFLGQYCKALSGWWQWDGTAWIQTHTLDGTPVAHKASHATGGADAITPGDIGAATAAQGSKADSALQPAAIGVTVASQGHTHAQLHDRQHAVTSASDHTFPGGTSEFLRADGTFATPPGGTVDNAAVNAAIATDSTLTRDSLLVAPAPFVGMTRNTLTRIAAAQTSGANATPLRIFVWGDSISGGIAPSETMAIKGIIGNVIGVNAGGAAQNTGGFDNWLTGVWGSLPSGGSIKWPVTGQNDIAGDTIAVIYLKEPGAANTNTMDLEWSSDGGSTWTKANGATPIDCNTGVGGGTIGAVNTYSVSTSNNPRYQIRALGRSGTVKIIGWGIYHASSNTSGVIWSQSLFAVSGHQLTEEIRTPSAIIAPIVSALAPDLFISCCADRSIHWNEAAATVNATLTNGSTTITFPTPGTEIVNIGTQISGTGIPAGTTVTSYSSSGGTDTCVLSQAATQSGSSTLTIRGAFLTMYDKLKAGDSTCDVLQIAPTPSKANNGNGPGNEPDRLANAKTQLAWALRSSESFFDGYSIFRDVDTGIANGLLVDETPNAGHLTDAGKIYRGMLLWKHVPVGNLPLGRIPLVSSGGNVASPHSNTNDLSLSAPVGSQSAIISPAIDMTVGMVRAADSASPSTMSRRAFLSANSGDGFLGIGSSNVIVMGQSSFAGAHPPANGRTLGGRGSFWWNVGAAGIRAEYRASSDGATVTIASTDYTIHVTAGSPTVTLPTPVAPNATVTNYTNAGAGVTGKIYVIRNTGAGTVTLTGTVDGVVNPTIVGSGRMVIQSTGSAWTQIG